MMAVETGAQQAALARVRDARAAQRRADDEYRRAVAVAWDALERRRGSLDRIAGAAGVTRQAIRKMVIGT